MPLHWVVANLMVFSSNKHVSLPDPWAKNIITLCFLKGHHHLCQINKGQPFFIATSMFVYRSTTIFSRSANFTFIRPDCCHISDSILLVSTFSLQLHSFVGHYILISNVPNIKQQNLSL